MSAPDPAATQPLREGRVPFGALLRQHRLAAGLSQEELAERAGLSVRALSALENGQRRAPYRHTVALLARALGLSATESAVLETAVTRERHPAGGTPLVWSTAPATLEHENRAAADVGAATGRSPVADLPTGTLTFMLTDIEGSTPLWECQPAAMQAALARHDALFDELLARHGGWQVKERGEGDSIFAVFTSPSAALSAACALQRALLAEPWPPQTPLRVRMGLHTGEAELRGISYYGATINRAARIRSLGHGGQVLLSQATAELVRGALPAGVFLRPLGSYALKGLAQPEAIWQVVHQKLPADFPPLASAAAHPTNLPAALTSFIGRVQEQEEVLALLGDARLVTLTGAGGAGKTRLALRVAESLLAEYSDGVWLVEPASLADPTLVPRAVAQVLGLREESGRPLVVSLTEALRTKHLLLVLDNCEHLIGACAELSANLLRSCPQVHLLITSREELEVAGEHTYRVPALAVPDVAHPPHPERLAQFEAVQLFVERARARRPDFELTALNAPAVSQICVRLDGIPLAIELAAARVGVLPVAQIAARLNDCFRLLTGGPRTALPHQQTLRATLDWSYDLLGEAERLLLRRLAVFQGGWTLEAAEAVCAGEGVQAGEVLELLAQLVHKSLVQLAEGEGEGRYRLLQTVRQYGWEKLAVAGDEAAVRERHLGWYLALAERADAALTGPEQGIWLARLEAEHDNMRAALSWCTREGSGPEVGVRLGGALCRFWEVRGHLGEGRSWLEAVLGRDGTAAPEVRARALMGAGILAREQDDYERARALLEESLIIRRDLGDRRGIAASLNNLGILARVQGNYQRARALLEESLALRRDLGDRWGIAGSLYNLGRVAQAQGDLERARALHEESLALRRDLGDRRGIAVSLNDLGSVAREQGDCQRARALHEESLAICRDLGDTWGIGYALHTLGRVAQAQGDLERARALHEESLALQRDLGYRRGIALTLNSLGRVAHAQGDFEGAQALCAEGLALFRDLGDRPGIAISLNYLGQLAAMRGEPQQAAILFGSAEALRETLGTPLEPSQRAAYDTAVAALRQTLPVAVMEAAWAAGRALSPDDAVARALAATPTT